MKYHIIFNINGVWILSSVFTMYTSSQPSYGFSIVTLKRYVILFQQKNFTMYVYASMIIVATYILAGVIFWQ